MRIPVPLRTTPYEVLVAPGARHAVAGDLARLTPRARAAVIVTTPALRQQRWWDLTVPLPHTVIEIAEGEAAKSVATVQSLCDDFARAGLSRHDVVVAVGGGATTDVVGFAAAVYLRGVAVVHVATTVAAQVDAAIGGKTGVNIGAGKNLVGAFHQPRAVYCDLDTLATLPERDRVAGLGEVAKCWLIERRPVADLSATSLQDLVAMAVTLKARVVAADEFETTGERATLNYGHTLGHAIEARALDWGVDELRHGEAVGLGLRFAVRLARHLGLVGPGEVAYTDEVVDFFGLPRTLPFPMDVDDLLVRMARDKKAHHGLTFVLPTADGLRVVDDVSADVVRATYASFTEGV